MFGAHYPHSFKRHATHAQKRVPATLCLEVRSGCASPNDTLPWAPATSPQLSLITEDGAAKRTEPEVQQSTPPQAPQTAMRQHSASSNSAYHFHACMPLHANTLMSICKHKRHMQSCIETHFFR